MAEQLMTLAYDNGINLFDTAEVYAAGKYGPFLTGKSSAGQPWLPGEEPEPLLLPGRALRSQDNLHLPFPACSSKL